MFDEDYVNDYDSDFDEDEIQEEFQRFRAEALNISMNQDKAIIEKWCEEIGYSYPLGYYNNRCDRTMEIYTTRPGICIGKAGSAIRKFEEMLKEEFRVPYKVKLVEIRGGFANIK